MKSITDRDVKIIELKAPQFIKAVAEAKKANAELIMMLDAFAGDPSLFYRICWYANNEGVAITLVPPKNT